MEGTAALPADRRRLVVVGVDGSANAAAALDWAARDVTWLGGRLVVVCAWHPADETAAGAHERSLGTRPPEEQAAEVLLDRLLADTAAPGLDVTGQVIMGPASAVLVTAAAELGADLLVVGARGLEGSRRISLGSVSSRCALRAHCAVVVVPPARP